MAIELKSIKYSRGAKVAAGLLVWLFFMTTLGSIVFLMDNQENLTTHNYYETNEFKTEFARIIHNTVELNTILKNEEHIKDSGQSENIIAAQLDRLQRIRTRFANSVNYFYYMENLQTGEIITNVSEITKAEAKTYIQKQPSVEHFSQWQADDSLPWSSDIQKMLTDSGYEIYAAVAEPMQVGDVFYQEQQAYSQIKYWSRYVVYSLIVSVVVMLLAFIFLVGVTGRKEKGGKVVQSPVDRIYTDVFSLLVMIAAIISVNLVSGNFSVNSVERIIFASFILSIDVWIGLTYVLSMIRQIKSRQLILNSVLYKLYTVSKSIIKLCFNSSIFKTWTLILIFGYGIVNVILGVSLHHSALPLIFILIFDGAVIYITAKALLYLAQIMKAAKEISAGNLEYKIDSSHTSVAFSGFAQDIQSIQGGLKKAVAEAVKGERMKTDLITNVSHDLKTPLTSIINYVDLLKQTELDDLKAVEYVGILEEKSARLKQLIDDLVEASKASSGNLTINAEKVDLHELVLQACGEYEEKLEQAELDVRLNNSDKSTYVFADGKYLWRIVENLFSNVIKYSMPNSRVYINIERQGQFALLTIKNISAFALELTPEQLTERFVRGDVSRSTEGSGLGLSIAQSLTSILGGHFKIEIDGDLFKVIVEIPLWME